VTDPEDVDEPAAWAAPWTAVALGLVAALGLGAWTVAATDPPGRLLVGLAALAVLGVTAVGALARPRLQVDEAGLALRGLTGTRRWPWEQVDAVRVVRMRRLGVPAAYLEVEARDGSPGAAPTDRLLVLGRLELGTDPVDVAESLQRHRALAGRRAAKRSDPGRTALEGERPERDEDDEHGGDPADGPEPGRGT
jgi:Bacterial PH domain